MASKPKRPRDPSQLAKMMVDIATGGETSEQEQGGRQKDPAAVERGRAGGLKGGKARSASLTQSEKRAIATKAARKRWAKV